MSTVAAQLVAKVTADTKDVHDKLDEVNNKVKDTGGFFSNAASTMLGFVGGAAIVGGVSSAFGFLKDTLGDCVSKAGEAERADAQLNAVLQSTHGAAGFTADAANKLADSLSSVTTYSDDAVKSTESVLLTFTNIGAKAMPAATEATLNLATAMGEDTKSAAVQLGKALNDPATGMTALQRVGVTFDAQQKKLIKTMQEHGDVAGAQKIILGELNKEFGNSARAAGDTFAGKLDILHNKFDEAKEKIGGAVIPILNNLLTAVLPLVTQFADKLPGALDAATKWFDANLKPVLSAVVDIIVKDLVPAVGNIAGKIGDFVGFLQTHQAAMDIFKAALIGVGIAIIASLVPAFIAWAVSAGAAAIATITATAPIIAIGVAIGLLILGIKTLIDHGDQVKAFFGKIFGAIGEFFGNVFGAIGDFAGHVLGAIGDLAHKLFDLYTWPYRMAWEFLQTILSVIGTFLHDAWDTIVNDVGAVVGGIFNFVKMVFENDLALVQRVMGAIGGFLHAAWDTIVTDVGNVLGGITTVANNIWNGIQGAFRGGINVVIGLINDFIGFLDTIQIHIPAIGVGPVHTPGLDWNGLGLPKIPMLADGGLLTEGGFAVVGERGPELLKLPGGSQVFPNDQSQHMLASLAGNGGARGATTGPVTIILQTPDGRELTRQVLQHLPTELRLATGTRTF